MNNRIKHTLATALACLCLSVSVYGQNSEQLSEDWIKKIEKCIGKSKLDDVAMCTDSVKENHPNVYQHNLETFLRFDGKVELKKGNNTEAFKVFSDALKLSKKKNNELETAKSSMELGLVFLYFNESQLAIKLFDDGEHLFSKLEEGKLKSRCGYLKAIAHKRLNEFELSNQILNDVLDFHQEANDSAGMAQTHNAIGVNHKNLHEVDPAVEHFSVAVNIYKSLNKQSNLAKTYNNLGNIYQLSKEWDKAIEQYTNSLNIKEKRLDTVGMALSYINLNVVYRDMGNIDSSFVFGEKSAMMLQHVEGAIVQKMGVYDLMSDLHELQNEFEKALYYRKKEKELSLQARVDDEATLIDLFEKKHDVKFYTIADSIQQSQDLLLGQIEETQSKNEELTKENSQVFNIALIVGFSLLFTLVIVMYWKYKSSQRMSLKLESTNKELNETRISKEEKEVLLQEIHHRVKNNMQIISSLIRLQSGQSDHQKTTEVFNETQNRITSMALVHELLYQTKNFEQLNLSEYLTELVDHLLSSYHLDIPISKSLNISTKMASIDSIIPIGLIVNEAVSNSLKHAFEGKEKGEISISLHNGTEEGYVLSISDNGNGENSANDKETNSLGTELIDSLVTQLDGNLSLDKGNGYNYTITIPEL